MTLNKIADAVYSWYITFGERIYCDVNEMYQATFTIYQYILSNDGDK